MTNSTDIYCSYGAVITNNTAVIIEGEVPDAASYTLWFFSCGQKGTVDVTFYAVNPGDNNLSSSQIYIPLVKLVFACIWAAFTLLWTVNWLMYRRQSILLHNYLHFIFIVKIISLVISYLRWQIQTQHGDTVVAPTVFDIALEFVFFEFLLHCVCFIGKGWCVVRIILTRQEHRLSVLISLSTAIGFLLFFVFQSYLLVVLIVMYILLVRYVYLNVNAIIYSLDMASTVAPIYSDAELYATAMQKKIKVLRTFQRGLGIYAFVVLVSIIGVRFFVLGEGWIEDMLQESYDFLFCAFLACLFRLRDFSEYQAVSERLQEAVSQMAEPAKTSMYAGLALPGGEAIAYLAIREEEQMEARSQGATLPVFPSISSSSISSSFEYLPRPSAAEEEHRRQQGSQPPEGR